MSNKGRIPPHAWTHEQKRVLVEMWKDNQSPTVIGAVIGKSRNSVSNYVRKYQHLLGIQSRPKGFYKGERNIKRYSHLDKEWSGSVPFGHWSVTKPWGWSQSFTEALREANRAGVVLSYGSEA